MKVMFAALVALVASALFPTYADSSQFGVSLDCVAPVVNSASLSVNLSSPPEGNCSLYAIVTEAKNRNVYTNLISFAAVSGENTCDLTHLNPGSGYTVKILAACGDVSVESAPVQFSTVAAELPVTAYVQDGLALQLDGIYNALDENGRPVKNAGVTNWVDITGNYDVRGKGTKGSLTHDGKSYVFGAGERYFIVDDATAIADAVIAGTFTVEATANMLKAPSSNNQGYGLFAIGSGTPTKPRLLCFDYRYSSATKKGCIQYNENESFSENSRLASYSGNDFLAPSTLTVSGQGGAGLSAKYYHSGVYKLEVPNQKIYNASSSIAKKLTIRNYSGWIDTRYDAFRAYTRVLSDEEIAHNNLVDAIRFRDDPTPIVPALNVFCLDNYKEGGAQVCWNIVDFGWPAKKIDSLTMQYSTTPDFANPVSVELGADIVADGNIELEGLVPGQTYYARVMAENSYGIASSVTGIKFKASSGPSDVPSFSIDSARAEISAAEGTIAITTYQDGGSACGAFAVVESADGIFTNDLFSGVSGAYTETVKLAPLNPGTDYTATFYVTNSAGSVSEAITWKFITPDEEVFVNPYINDGMISYFDAIMNAIDGNGKPLHRSSQTVWGDLKGGLKMENTTGNGAISFSSKLVRFSTAASLRCSAADAAIDAIINGQFTVENVSAFQTLSESYPAFYSFGSGTDAAPRLLVFDARRSSGKIGAVQYNEDNDWATSSMLFYEFDFLQTNTYAIVGNDVKSNDGMMYVNGEEAAVVKNNNVYGPNSYDRTKNDFNLHWYNNGYHDVLDFYAVRIYNRNLSKRELAANRFADEVRFFNREASLRIVSQKVSGNMLTVTLEREGCAIAADIYAVTASEYSYAGQQEFDTGCDFEKNGENRITVTIPLEDDTAYVWFKSAGLVSKHVYVHIRGDSGDTAVTSQSVKSVGTASAVLATGVIVPQGAEPVELYAAYGYLPDALTYASRLDVVEGTVAQSGVVDGVLRALQPGRTYYVQAFAMRNGVEVGRSPSVSSFTTDSATAFASEVVKITGVNYEGDRVASLQVAVDAGRACELWMFYDLGDQGFMKNDWKDSVKVADVAAEGGEFTVPVPQGWGDTVKAVRFATGTVTPIESVRMTGSVSSCINTHLYIKGSARIDLDLQLHRIVKQVRLFSAGNSKTITYQLYINGSSQWAYAWSCGEGNWVGTAKNASTSRVKLTIDGYNAIYDVSKRGAMKYAGSKSPVTVTAGSPLKLLGTHSEGASIDATLWSAQVVDDGGKTQLGDYIPAMMGSEACVYDRVSRRVLFASNGTLAAGEAIEGAQEELADASEVFLHLDAATLRLDPEVSVSGHETGTSLTFSGKVANATRVTVNGFEATIGDDGSWSVVIAEGIEPGVPYDCKVIAYGAGGEIDVLPVFTETTLAGTDLVPTMTATRDQRTLTFSGKVVNWGAGDTKLTLLTGTSAETLVEVVSQTKKAGDDTDFVFTWKAAEFGVPVYWTVACENSVPGNGALRWAETNAVSSITPIDAAVYTWTDVEGNWSGNWSDTAHWSSDKPEDCIGWPCVETAKAAINQGEITLDKVVTIASFVFGTDGQVVFTGGEGELSIVSDGNAVLGIPDGADILVKDGAVVNLPQVFRLAPATKSITKYAASFAVNNATVSILMMYLTHDGTFIVQDGAMVSCGHAFFACGMTSSGADFGSKGGVMRIEGKAPYMTVSGNLRSMNSADSSGGGRIEFKVPAGGFAQTPLVMTGTAKGNSFCGDSKVATKSATMSVLVTEDSPMYGGASVDVELVKWSYAHTDGAKLAALQPLRDEKGALYITDDMKTLRLEYTGAPGTLLILL